MRPEEDGLDRVEENAQIETDREMFDVIEIVTHLLGLFVEIVRVSVPNLCPAGDPRANDGAERVVRDILDEELVVRDRVRSRPDQVHIALDDVKELRELVEPELPQPLTDPGDPLGVVADPLRLRCIDQMHGTELDQIEALRRYADPLLDEEHRTTGIQLDQNRDEEEQRRQHDHPDDGDQQTDDTAGGQVETCLFEIWGEDQAARCECLDRELSSEAFVDVYAVFHDASPDSRLQKLANRQARAPFGERDDRSVGSELLENLSQVVQRPAQPVCQGEACRDRGVDDADDLVTQVRLRLDLSD